MILNGDESTNAHEPDGFLTTLAAPSAPGAVAAYADYAGSHAGGVDGIHASAWRPKSRAVIGTATYQHAASVYQAGSGESGSEALKRRSAGCMASSFVPAPVVEHSERQHLPRGRPERRRGGDARRLDRGHVAYPRSDPGHLQPSESRRVVLTWVALWDAQTAFRASAYRRVAFQLA